MRQEDIALKKKWYDEIRKQTIQDRIENVTADTLEEQFKINFRNMIFVDVFGRFKDDSGPAIFQNINHYLDNGYYLDVDGDRFVCSFKSFQESELYEALNLLREGIEDPVLKNKAHLYADFLKANRNRFADIDILIQLIAREEDYPSLRELVKTKVKSAFIDIQKLDQQQITLFWNIDSIYLLMLLNPKNQNGRQRYIDNFPNIFDFELYKNPSLIREFPREKETFLKILKTWFMDQIETRKKLFEWDHFPPEYQYILDYAESLIPKTEKMPIVAKVNALAKPIVRETSDYPKHIFANEKAYQMFSLLMKYIKSHAAISFVFRTMAEKEKPQLILVNDTPFRNWFNVQQGYIPLDTYTKTYENSKNEDRIASYNIAKELMMSN